MKHQENPDTSIREIMTQYYDAMWNTRQTWLSRARHYVGKSKQLTLSENESAPCFPTLTLNDEDGKPYLVTFDMVRLSDNGKLEFEVEDSNGYLYEHGDWMAENDFPNNDWELLIPTIVWPE